MPFCATLQHLILADFLGLWSRFYSFVSHPFQLSTAFIRSQTLPVMVIEMITGQPQHLELHSGFFRVPLLGTLIKGVELALCIEGEVM